MCHFIFHYKTCHFIFDYKSRIFWLISITFISLHPTLTRQLEEISWNFVIKFPVQTLKRLTYFVRKPHDHQYSCFVAIHACLRQTTDRQTDDKLAYDNSRMCTRSTDRVTMTSLLKSLHPTLTLQLEEISWNFVIKFPVQTLKRLTYFVRKPHDHQYSCFVTIRAYLRQTDRRQISLRQ